jgi:hypothetical protein
MTTQQGWTVDNVGHTITFYTPPANGAAIAVNEFAQGAVNATNLWSLGAWGPSSGYPVEVEFFSNRLFFAGTQTNPATVWSSKISQWNNFGHSVPTADDDAITATLVARQVNAIHDLVPLKDLVTLTTGSEWRTTGGTANVLTPSTISFLPQSNYGSSPVPSLVVGNSALFVQGRGDYVRDLAYQFAVDQYSGNDLTVFSSHLVQGHQIVDWTYQQTPFSVVWAVRNDGVLLGLAYFKEQEVMGWFHCDTVNGFVESVCSITEGDEDAVYMVVRRVINGQTVRFVERLNSRFFVDQRDANFVDAGLSYDGRNSTTAPSATMTLTGGTTWTSADTLTLTCAGATPFSALGVNADWVKLYGYTPQLDSAGNPVTDDFGTIQQVQTILACQIIGYTSSSVVQVRSIGDVPKSMQAIAVASWDYCPLSFGGMQYLQGQVVSILADGNVKAQQKVPASGTITLDAPAAVVHIGLPITADFQTLEVNAIGQEGVRDKRKIISKVTLIVNKSRGAMIGPDPANLLPMKGRLATDNYYPPNALQNDLIEAYVQTTFSTQGVVFVRQSEPLPLNILGVIADVSVAGG